MRRRWPWDFWRRGIGHGRVLNKDHFCLQDMVMCYLDTAISYFDMAMSYFDTAICYLRHGHVSLGKFHFFCYFFSILFAF